MLREKAGIVFAGFKVGRWEKVLASFYPVIRRGNGVLAGNLALGHTDLPW